MAKKIFVITILFFLGSVTLALLNRYIYRFHGDDLYYYTVASKRSFHDWELVEQLRKLSTKDLLLFLKGNEDAPNYPKKHFKRMVKGHNYLKAVEVLASRTDPEAIEELSVIVVNSKRPQAAWAAIGYSGESKNRQMSTALCNALRLHWDSHTDELIVEALDKINDPSGLDCLVQEKEKIQYKDSYELAGELIQRWQKTT